MCNCIDDDDYCCCCGPGLLQMTLTLAYEMVGCTVMLIFIALKLTVVLAPERTDIGDPIGIRLINAYKRRKAAKALKSSEGQQGSAYETR